jgi:hypothetical protein
MLDIKDLDVRAGHVAPCLCWRAMFGSLALDGSDPFQPRARRIPVGFGFGAARELLSGFCSLNLRLRALRAISTSRTEASCTGA